MKADKIACNPFTLHMFKKNPSVMNAVNAIKEYAHAGQPIPIELLTHLDNACLAYEKQEGRYIKDRRADIRKYLMVHDAHLYILQDGKEDEAFAAVAKRNHVDSKTVKRYYDASEWAEAKLEAKELHYSLTH